jgi:outer membrane lipoprotein-sorting protein
MKASPICLSGLLIAAGLVPASFADDRADAALCQVAAAYERLSFLRANIRVTNSSTSGAKATTTGHVRLLRPNLARLDLTTRTADSTNRLLIVSDGKVVWEWLPKSSSYTRRDADPKGTNVALYESWLDLYFDPMAAIRSRDWYRTNRFLRFEKVDGIRCRVIEIRERPTLSLQGHRDSTLFIDPEGLVRKVVVKDDFVLPTTTVTTFDYLDIRSGTSVDPSDYWFCPPEAAKLQQDANEDKTGTINPNAVLDNGNTPLMEAAFQGRLSSVRTLLDNGADVLAKDSSGRTALMSAIIGAHSESNGVAKVLIEHGADVNAKDNHGCTPLILAAKYEVADILEPLLAHGAEIEAIDQWGSTALMNTSRGDLGAILIAHGANVNIRDGAGQTPLTQAARCGNSGLVRVLLAHSADPSAREPDGSTALTYAWAQRYSDIAEMITDAMQSPRIHHPAQQK